MHQDYNNDDNGHKKHQIKVQTITQRENTNQVMVQMSVPRDLLFLYQKSRNLKKNKEHKH